MVAGGGGESQQSLGLGQLGQPQKGPRRKIKSQLIPYLGKLSLAMYIPQSMHATARQGAN